MKKTRKKVFTVGRHECRWDYFRSGGKGGQNQNTRDTGVRCVHEPSGATGESREANKQWQNRKIAFKRMAETEEFKRWAVREASKDLLSDAVIMKAVDEAMKDENLLIEVRVNNKWVGADILEQKEA